MYTQKELAKVDDWLLLTVDDADDLAALAEHVLELQPRGDPWKHLVMYDHSYGDPPCSFSRMRSYDSSLRTYTGLRCLPVSFLYGAAWLVFVDTK